MAKDMKDNLIKVVICDDHAIFREGIKTALRTCEDIVVIGEAENGMRLLQELKHVTPDIILLDINMPVMDGFATLPQLKKLYPEIKVIVLSWNNDMTWVTSMMNLGANSYLTKDDESANIIDAIKTCYTREFYMNELTEKGIKFGLGKTKPTTLPVTKFEAEKSLEEDEEEVEVPTKSVWKRIGKGILFAIIALSVLALIYFGITSLKDHMNFIEEFSLGNKTAEF
jgi:DNA-binding NarL/FixJ family response regulator